MGLDASVGLAADMGAGAVAEILDPGLPVSGSRSATEPGKNPFGVPDMYGPDIYGIVQGRAQKKTGWKRSVRIPALFFILQMPPK